jgi:hypothetical protein
MAKSQFRKGCNQQSKKLGLIRTVVFKLGAGMKVALQTVIVSKKEKTSETKKT